MAEDKTAVLEVLRTGMEPGLVSQGEIESREVV
jgi:hypothetical protein